MQIENVHVRIYKAAQSSSANPKPAMIYYHGGGFAFGVIPFFLYQIS